MFLANLARTNLDTSVPTQTALFPNGQYVQAAPGAILAIFIFIGTAILLYIRFLTLTTFSVEPSLSLWNFTPLYPPWHLSSSNPVKQSNQVGCCSFRPLAKSCLDPFDIAAVNADNARNQATLGPLAQAARLLPFEVAYSRYIPRDWRPLQDLARRVAVRANGMLIDFTLVDPTRERFPVQRRDPGHLQERALVLQLEDIASHHTIIISVISFIGRIYITVAVFITEPRHRMEIGTPHMLLVSGVFESQRYLNLEAHALRLTNSCKKLTPRFSSNVNPPPYVFTWFADVVSRDEKLEEVLCRLRKFARMDVVTPMPLTQWTVLSVQKIQNNWNSEYNQLTSHRYLFNCYVYQYHLQCDLRILGELLDHVIRLETRPERRHRRVWTPKFYSLTSVTVFLEWIKGFWTENDNVGRSASAGAEGEEEEEEDPDRVQHVDRELSGATRVGNGVLNDEEDNMYGMGLPYPKQRDPDVLLLSNVGEFMDRWIYNRVVGLTTGNTLYAVKAGVPTTLMCIPFFIPGSAQFAYDNRFLWGIIMALLTSARFRGDTTFGFLTRIFSTFLGGGVGTSSFSDRIGYEFVINSKRSCGLGLLYAKYDLST
ncbi:hypothetical protein GG344DRAFT_68810 [Lentinula edodes]|nr:hypothetical protein GG344DRAFT_68810 [Lentinula edodes]